MCVIFQSFLIAVPHLKVGVAIVGSHFVVAGLLLDVDQRGAKWRKKLLFTSMRFQREEISCTFEAITKPFMLVQDPLC